MDETTKTISAPDDEDVLGPTERRKAAARILARGIRRLLTRAPSPDMSAARESEMDGISAPTGKPERDALPVIPRRALMARTRAG